MARQPREKERYEVLYEKIVSEVGAISEGHGGLVREIHGMHDDLGARLSFLEKMTMEGFGKVWQAINQVNARLDKLQTR